MHSSHHINLYLTCSFIWSQFLINQQRPLFHHKDLYLVTLAFSSQVIILHLPYKLRPSASSNSHGLSLYQQPFNSSDGPTISGPSNHYVNLHLIPHTSFLLITLAFVSLYGILGLSYHKSFTSLHRPVSHPSHRPLFHFMGHITYYTWATSHMHSSYHIVS